MKRSISTLDIVLGAVFIILCFATLYPFIYALSYSVSDTVLAAQKSIIFLPRGFTLLNYKIIFSDNRIMYGAIISVAKTFSGTVLFLVVTGLCAYTMSRPKLRGKKLIFIFFVIPMYVNGGLLPYYILIHDLGLFNNFLVYIIPTCFSGFYMFLIKVFMETIPESLEESAKLDGANDWKVATQIILPLSKPVFATVALFVGVNQWNAWFDSLLFITKDNLKPLQLILQIILRETQIDNIIQVYAMSQGMKTKINAESFKMAVLIITTIPIVFIYPFAQKYFIKGLTIGAVKL